MRAKPFIWAGALIVVAGLAAATVLKIREGGFFESAVHGGPATMRLISAEQYVNTMHFLFGEDIDVRANFPSLQRKQGLVSLSASTAAMTSGALEQFDRAARAIATQVLDEAHRGTLVPCTPRSLHESDADCAGRFFARVGRFLYRRPLSAPELRAYVDMADKAAGSAGDFYVGLTYSLAGMLTSPQFLYITEISEPDPDHAGQYRLDAYSRASRLSLFLWNALPDDLLLTAAETGELHEHDELNRQIGRMLASSQLEQGVRAFFSDLLHVDDFRVLSKDPVIYPAFTYAVSQAVHEQTLRMITDRLLVQRADYRDLFTSNRTLVNRMLGPLYQVPVPGEASEAWIPYEMKSDASAGVLTALSFLAAHSHPGRSSPTRRGMAIREIFLCQKVPDPPPTVDFARFEALTGHKTARERLAAHNVDPVCVGCHKLTDPAGLALENFDGAGLFRTQENTAPIDAHGEFDGRAFDGVAGLGKAVSEHPALTPCLPSRLYAYGVGREIGRSDREWLAWITRRFAAHGYRLPDLLREIAASDGFYAVSAPGSEPVPKAVLTSVGR